MFMSNFTNLWLVTLKVFSPQTLETFNPGQLQIKNDQLLRIN